MDKDNIKQVGSNEEQKEKARWSDESASFHFTTDPDEAKSRDYRNFCIHIFCTRGSAHFRALGKEWDIAANNCLVLLSNGTLEWLQKSDDFEIVGVFISNKYITSDTPDTNYFTLGALSVMDDPVLPMTGDDMSLCLAVIDAIKARLVQHTHLFYHGELRRCVETLMLDLFNIHSRSVSIRQTAGNQGMRLFRAFISMLESGKYKQEREVNWYANELGISPKYLSEVCHDCSNHGASHWINRFTTEEIARLLHNPTMSINSIASLMNFNTTSYFSHYVKARLGMTPKDYRLTVLGMKHKGVK